MLLLLSFAVIFVELRWLDIISSILTYNILIFSFKSKIASSYSIHFYSKSRLYTFKSSNTEKNVYKVILAASTDYKPLNYNGSMFSISILAASSLNSFIFLLMKSSVKSKLSKFSVILFISTSRLSSSSSSSKSFPSSCILSPFSSTAPST